MNIVEYKKSFINPLRQATLCFLIKGDQVLLAMKKRGFGKGRWNGVGGKPNPGENIDQTAIRETQEEIGVTLKHAEVRAVLDFYFPDNPDWSQQVIVYFSKSWEGIPGETEEMKPLWYKKNNLPLNEMWPDDKHWLPQALEGSMIRAEFLFGENDTVLDFSVNKVESLNI